jgi:hypothetical protein
MDAGEEGTIGLMMDSRDRNAIEKRKKNRVDATAKVCNNEI